MRFFTPTQKGVAAIFTVAISVVVLSQDVGAQTAWSCNGVPATIVGTSGPDTMEGTPGEDVIVGREGDDVITALGGDDVVCAGKGNDLIFGGGGFDIIFAAQGNDTIYAADGATPETRVDTKGARMFGGAGNDTIHGSTRWDRMQGGIGDDNLFGYEGRDWMRAGPDRDNVDGGAGIDDMHGGNGADTIEMTTSDVVRGGAGLDRCNIADGAASRLISCGLNTIEAATQPPMTTASQVVVVSCDARAETVGIRNGGDESITLNLWKLYDEDMNFEHLLNGIVVDPGQTQIMLSGAETTDVPGAIRWSDRNVWNNEGDVATLARPDGTKSTFDC